MLTPILVIAGILVLGAFCYAFPFAYKTYRRFRYRKLVICPVTHDFAEAALDVRWAALSAILDKPKLRVKSCSLWPKKKGCAEHCVVENWPSQ
jgi:hypothetical protein